MCSPSRRRYVRLVLVAAGIATATRAAAVQPDAATIRFWNGCVAAVERDLDATSPQPAVNASTVYAANELLVEPIDRHEDACVPPSDVSATIQRWRGTVLVPHMTVDGLLRSLQTDLPRQQDVLAARFVAVAPDSLTVRLRLVRRKIITVIFDTEHEMRIVRASPALAFSRSVMTRVAEVEDAGSADEHPRRAEDDRGFLWRLNAYSTYARRGDDVLVTVESLTLSRGVPRLLKPVASRIIDSIARESMLHTLEGLRQRGG